MIPDFFKKPFIVESIACPKCTLPIVSEEIANKIQKELDWEEKKKEFERKAEEYRKKNPPPHETGFTDNHFFIWFDVWIKSQIEKHQVILKDVAKSKIKFKWLDRKVLLIELAASLKENLNDDQI